MCTSAVGKDGPEPPGAWRVRLHAAALAQTLMPEATSTSTAAAETPLLLLASSALAYEGASRPVTGGLSRPLTAMLVSRKSARTWRLGRLQSRAKAVALGVGNCAC